MTYFAKMHLTKNSNGKIACGRNAHNSHMSAKWEQFSNTPVEHQCEACAASKAAAFYAKSDADKWEPEDSDAWMKADDAFVAKNK